MRRKVSLDYNGEALIRWQQGGRRGAEGDENGEGNGKRREAMYKDWRLNTREDERGAWATSRDAITTHGQTRQ